VLIRTLLLSLCVKPFAAPWPRSRGGAVTPTPGRGSTRDFQLPANSARDPSRDQSRRRWLLLALAAAGADCGWTRRGGRWSSLCCSSRRYGLRFTTLER